MPGRSSTRSRCRRRATARRSAAARSMSTRRGGAPAGRSTPPPRPSSTRPARVGKNGSATSGNGPMKTIDVATLRQWLSGGGEIALVDVREEGEHCGGHPLLAVHLAYSRLELDIERLVPRKSVRLVLVDGGDGVAARAGARLEGLGYGAVHALSGGVAAWEAAGYPLFPSSNVPSKAFAEVVEIGSHTPHVTAAELAELQRGGAKLKILDSRTVEEFNRFHVPGAVTCPGAELVYRFADLMPDPDTLVVVSCAGRTRSIIGAQSLINAGVPNKVVSLQGGTQGWRLAGLELERDTQAAVPPVSAEGAVASAARAALVAARY